MDLIIGILAFVFAILQIILFFKIWGMTNDVSELKNFIINRHTQQKNDENIHESRKVTRLSDGKQLFIKYEMGDTYECFDPNTKKYIGRYMSSEIKKGW